MQRASFHLQISKQFRTAPSDVVTVLKFSGGVEFFSRNLITMCFKAKGCTETQVTDFSTERGWATKVLKTKIILNKNAGQNCLIFKNVYNVFP